MEENILREELSKIISYNEYVMNAIKIVKDDDNNIVFNSNYLVFLILKYPEVVPKDLLKIIRNIVLSNSSIARINIEGESFLELVLKNKIYPLSYNEKIFVIGEVMSSFNHIDLKEDIVIEILSELVPLKKKKDIVCEKEPTYNLFNLVWLIFKDKSFSLKEKEYYVNIFFTDETWKNFISWVFDKIFENNIFEIAKEELSFKEYQEILLTSKSGLKEENRNELLNFLDLLKIYSNLKSYRSTNNILQKRIDVF